MANRLAKVMGTVQGVADLSVLTELGQPNLLVRVDRERAARYGVLPGDVNGIVQATIGGQPVSQVLDGERRFDVVVRFVPQYRNNVDTTSNIPVSMHDSGRSPLKQVAETVQQTRAPRISRDDNGR